MNKFIWTIIFIVLGAVALIFVYWWVSGIWTAPTETSLLPSLSETEDDVIDEKIKNVSGKELANYWFDNDGRLYLMEESGEVVGVSSRKLEGINQVKSSADGRRALVSFNYPDNLAFAVIDTIDRSWTPLPEGTIAAAWHPTNEDRLVYLRNSGLRIFNLATNRSEFILRINLVDAVLDWPEVNKVLLADRPSAIVDSKVWEINLRKKTIKEVISGGGVIVKEDEYWQLQFFGSISGRADRLVLVDKEEDFSMDITVTLPEKCVLDQFKIYCAFPKNISSAVTLPDDYLKRKFISEDAFYAIIANPQGGIETKLIHDPLLAVDVTNLEKVGDKLYFLNRQDHKLYYLEL